jgi:hypothetical protein
MRSVCYHRSRDVYLLKEKGEENRKTGYSTAEEEKEERE